MGLSSVIDIDRDISDHNATEIEINVNCKCINHIKREVWLYDQGDFESFNTEIEQVDWDSLFNNGNIDSCCKSFTDKYLEIARKHIPNKLVTVRMNDKPWFNSTIRREIRVRDRLSKKARASGLISDLNKYKKQRNRVNNMKKSAKERYFMEIYGIIDNCSSNNSKEFWKLVKTLTKSSGTKNSIPPLFDPITNSIQIEDDKKANILNKYFVDISTIDENDTELPDFPLRTDKSISHIEFTENDIIDILTSLKSNKAIGIDYISHNMLKYTASTISRPLNMLFKMSLEKSVFPSL